MFVQIQYTVVMFNLFVLLADGPNDRIQMILDAGFCPHLPQFLLLDTDKERQIIIPALRAIGNILTGDDLQTQV